MKDPNDLPPNTDAPDHRSDSDGVQKILCDIRRAVAALEHNTERMLSGGDYLSRVRAEYVPDDKITPNTHVDHAALDAWTKNNPPGPYKTDAERVDYELRKIAEYDLDLDVRTLAFAKAFGALRRAAAIGRDQGVESVLAYAKSLSHFPDGDWTKSGPEIFVEDFREKHAAGELALTPKPKHASGAQREAAFEAIRDGLLATNIRAGVVAAMISHNEYARLASVVADAVVGAEP